VCAKKSEKQLDEKKYYAYVEPADGEVKIMFFILCGKNLTMNVFEDLRE
jgi:hypothetical protein